jgi:hypothetical protein
MNPSDEDLNCLLKAWTAPRSPDSLEGRLRRAYGDRVRSRTTVLSGEAGQQRKWSSGVWTRWIAQFAPTAGKVAAVMAGAVVLLAVITRAFPQSLNLVVPTGAIILDSEFLDYKNDGSYAVSEYRTSSFRRATVERDIIEGGETVLASSFPGDLLRTAAGDVLNPMRASLEPIAHSMIDPLFYKPGRAEYLRALAMTVTERIRKGCTPSNMWGRPMTVIGEETVLNYTTTVSQFAPEGGNFRFTEWFAPELDCFSLRSTTEKALPDGAFQLANERRVLKVTKNSSTTKAKEQNR